MADSYSYLSKIYDTMMHDVDYDAWSKYIASFIKGEYPDKKINILETACGTGNITWRLAKEGYSVIASDISEEMLAKAAQNLAANGQKAVLIIKDMQNITLNHSVEVIISVCDGINYLNAQQVQRFFKTAYANLKEGGILLFDISSEFKYKEVIANNVFCDEDDSSAYIWKNTLNKNSCEMDVTIFIKENDVFKRFSEQHKHYIHSEKYLKARLLSAGFSKVKTFDCFTKDMVKENSNRIQFLAKKG
ncbi:MAG: class I SAM-dependent methyltransferase [Eubacteriales bacterium]